MRGRQFRTFPRSSSSSIVGTMYLSGGGTMGIGRELKEKARMTREDGVFTLKLDEGISLAMLSAFAQDMFPGVNLEDVGVWPAR